MTAKHVANLPRQGGKPSRGLAGGGAGNLHSGWRRVRTAHSKASVCGLVIRPGLRGRTSGRCPRLVPRNVRPAVTPRRRNKSPVVARRHCGAGARDVAKARHYPVRGALHRGESWSAAPGANRNGQTGGLLRSGERRFRWGTPQGIVDTQSSGTESRNKRAQCVPRRGVSRLRQRKRLALG